MMETLLERRQEMLRLRSTGLSLSTIVNDLSRKYEITRRGLYLDWKNRKRWIRQILSLKDPETFFLDILATQKEIYKHTFLEYMQADNSNAKIGALRLLRDLLRDQFEMVSVHDLLIRIERLEELTS